MREHVYWLSLDKAVAGLGQNFDVPGQGNRVTQRRRQCAEARPPPRPLAGQGLQPARGGIGPLSRPGFPGRLVRQFLLNAQMNSAFTMPFIAALRLASMTADFVYNLQSPARPSALAISPWSLHPQYRSKLQSLFRINRHSLTLPQASQSGLD